MRQSGWCFAGGLTCQGLGYTVSCMMYAVLLLRLMTEGFPPARARPGLFMCCGPPAFTIICLLGLAQEMQRILPALPLPSLPASTYETLFISALAASILLWAVAAWFYLVTLAAIAAALLTERRNMQFILAWWAAVFPITGFATATNAIADALDSSSIKILAQIMVVVLAVVFVAIAAAHIHAVATAVIMAEGKDEDRLIDTMHRDAEKVPSAEGERETPPTYPNTPAVSVFRLERKLTA